MSLLIRRDDFDTDTTGEYTRYTEDNAGDITVENSLIKASYPNGGWDWFKAPESINAPVVVVSVLFQRLDDNGQVGVMQDNNNRIMAVNARLENKIRIEIKKNGTLYFLDSADVNPDLPYYLIFILKFKWVDVFYSTDGVNFTPVIRNCDVSGYFDLTDPNTLANFKPVFGGGGGSGVEWHVDLFDAQYFVGYGIRDISAVKKIVDPYDAVKDANGKIYITGTLAMDVMKGIEGVCKLDPSTGDVEIVGLIVPKRDGKFKYDHAGHVVYDPSTNKYIALLSTWQDNNEGGTVKLSKSEMTTIEGVVTPDATKIDFDTEDLYDFDCIKSDSDYIVVCVHRVGGGGGDYHLAKYSTPDFSTFNKIRESTDTSFKEGFTIVKAFGKLYITGTDRKVFDFDTLDEIGTLNAPYTYNGSWYSVFKYLDGSVYRFGCLYFDNSDVYGFSGVNGVGYYAEGDKTES